MRADDAWRRRWIALALLVMAGCDRPAGLPPAPSPAPENKPLGLRPPALPGSAASGVVG
ncbi:hypothetical protein HLB44_14450 [Aquincola sp. S2]|uniref:Uncharacterized protein n=1 Tax=Pseudaquabacterium terrae TaxID=2732868 RepID=A0ABX2EHZ1_9BURK|nr:hypothetical protein [Aquabacterium terrae]NRF68191.1 hypothetical protein [Aquabacterium terrae]